MLVREGLSAFAQTLAGAEELHSESTEEEDSGNDRGRFWNSHDLGGRASEESTCGDQAGARSTVEADFAEIVCESAGVGEDQLICSAACGSGVLSVSCPVPDRKVVVAETCDARKNEMHAIGAEVDD